MRITRNTSTATLLSLMMVLVPALGVPHEELLQDTLKSILVAFFALGASFVFFWQQRKHDEAVHWHGVMLLPLALMVYALGSMAWSHPYLAGVEAVRWFVFSLLLFLGLNTLTLERVTHLAWGIHLGAVIASLWAALQFWIDWKYFAQGPNPASTFINRNFFGEYLVCTLPFSVLLLSRVRDKASVFLLTFSLGFNVVALLMTGTRSALLGLIILGVLLPVIVVLYGKQFVSSGWRTAHCIGVVLLLIATVGSIGSINSANPKLIAESGPGNAIDRAFRRSSSLANTAEYTQGSFAIRTAMWKATARMISAHPLAGVGAGAWEVQVPLYQVEGSQIETDYYAHNEILQLLGEYGLVGWIFLLWLLLYLLRAAFNTWSNRSPEGTQESLLRALTLASLLVLLVVSNAGFPWRMASTGALFALSLSVLLASDIRLDLFRNISKPSISWQRWHSVAALCLTAVCTGIGLYIAQQAIACESKIVRAVKIAQSISASGHPHDPGWMAAKLDMLTLINEGVGINPHYRKLTPIVADALSAWGDSKNATWIWESVLKSRPHVVAIVGNVVRSHLQVKEIAKAQEQLDRALHRQPNNPTLRTLQVIIWSQGGKTKLAADRARELLNSGTIEPDLIRVAYHLGMQNRDIDLAILALETHIKSWPEQAADGWLKLGDIYQAPDGLNEEKALNAYRAALAATRPVHRDAVLNMIPAAYREQLR